MVQSIIITLIICGTLITLSYFTLKYKNTCRHKWEKVDEEKVWKTKPTDPENDPMYVHRYVIMQCNKCGNIKTIKIC